MSRFRALLGLTTGLALLSLLLNVGCSRPTEINGTEGSAAPGPHEIPFREADGKGSADSDPSPVSPVSDKLAKTETGLPFRDPEILPAGTLITVRLKNPVSADDPAASGRFEGIIDESVTVDGNLLVPRGTSVAGRVESARSSKAKGNGFVRVTLDSIAIAGKDLHLQTSSLFARGHGMSHGPTIETITVEQGRRLTFRLTEPANVGQPRASTR
jgi:hypothetical protein